MEKEPKTLLDEAISRIEADRVSEALNKQRAIDQEQNRTKIINVEYGERVVPLEQKIIKNNLPVDLTDLLDDFGKKLERKTHSSFTKTLDFMWDGKQTSSYVTPDPAHTPNIEQRERVLDTLKETGSLNPERASFKLWYYSVQSYARGDRFSYVSCLSFGLEFDHENTYWFISNKQRERYTNDNEAKTKVVGRLATILTSNDPTKELEWYIEPTPEHISGSN